MRARAKLALLLGVLGSVAACSVLTNFDDLTNDRATTVIVAEGGPGADAIASDAATDGLATMDGSAPDARVMTAPFCASLSPQPFFCVDFDDGNLALPFDQSMTINGGLNVIDDAASSSPPFSLLSTVPPTSAGVYPTSYLGTAKTTGNAHGVHLAFDVRVDQADTAHGTPIAYFSLAQGSTKTDFRIAIGSAAVGDITIVEELVGFDGGTQYLGHHSTPKSLAQWTHVDVALAVSPSPVLSMKVDADMIFDGESMSSTWSTGAPYLAIGTWYPGPPAIGWKIHYDNVTYDPAF